MESLSLNLLSKLMVDDGSPILPLIGFCHSYDYDSGETNLRRIRVNYPSKDGSIAVSPLLWRVVSHSGSDPPVPKLGDLIFGFWTKADRSEGVYLGIVQNQPSVSTPQATADWFEISDDGIFTIRAKEIRLLATEKLELSCRIQEEGYTQIRLTDGSEIEFRDYSGRRTVESIETRLRKLENP